MVINWKKSGKNSYRKRDSNRFLQIGTALKDDSKYGVYTQLPGKKLVTLKTNIRTKASAVRFARAYMKKKK